MISDLGELPGRPYPSVHGDQQGFTNQLLFSGLQEAPASSQTLSTGSRGPPGQHGLSGFQGLSRSPGSGDLPSGNGLTWATGGNAATGSSESCRQPYTRGTEGDLGLGQVGLTDATGQTPSSSVNCTQTTP